MAPSRHEIDGEREVQGPLDTSNFDDFSRGAMEFRTERPMAQVAWESSL